MDAKEIESLRRSVDTHTKLQRRLFAATIAVAALLALLSVIVVLIAVLLVVEPSIDSRWAVLRLCASLLIAPLVVIAAFVFYYVLFEWRKRQRLADELLKRIECEARGQSDQGFLDQQQ